MFIITSVNALILSVGKCSSRRSRQRRPAATSAGRRCFDTGTPNARPSPHERSPPIWLWHVTVTIPGPPFGDAKTIDEAKARFKEAWLAFKHKVGAEALAKSYAEMNHANRPERYQR